MGNHLNRSRFRWIDAEGRDVTGTEAVAGYSVQDFFVCDIHGASPAELAAAYKGPDSDGIGARWTQD
jgi:hypothetical protein